MCEAPPPERWVRTRPTDDGMMRLEASLHPDEAALVMKAIELARGIGGEAAMIDTAVIDAPDALMNIVRAFLGGEREARASSGADHVELVVHVTPALASLGGGASAESPASAAEGSTTLGARLEDGTRLEPAALRRLGCDCTVQPIVLDGAGLPIDVGRRSRVVSGALRRALRVRDGGGCRFPGCEHRGWIDAHHVEHWMDGGPTALHNLISLCPAHHRRLHEGGVSVALEADGRAVFRDAREELVAPVPAPPPLRLDWRGAWRNTSAAPLTDLTLLPRWDGRAPDYRACIEAALPRESFCAAAANE